MTRPPSSPRSVPLTPHHMSASSGLIADALAELKKRLHAYFGIDALLVLTTFVCWMFWGTLALDYLPVRLAGADETPRVVRLVLIWLTLAGVVWILIRGLVLPRLRRITPSQAALVMERRFPRLAESLVTSVELAALPASVATQAMLRHVTESAEAQLRDISVGDVFDYRPLRRNGVIAAVSVASMALFATFALPTFLLACSRIYLLTDAPWPRATYLEAVGFQDHARKVARGDDLVLQVRADATRDVPPPDVCHVYYRTSDGDRGRATLTREGTPVDGFQYYQYADRPFRGILSDIELDIVGNDFRLKQYRILALDSPAFTDPQLRMTPPPYTGLTPVTEPPRDGIRVPQGTQITFSSVTNRPLKSVKIVDTLQGTEEIREIPPSDTANFEYDLGIISDAKLIEFHLTDHEGLHSSEPYRVALAVLPDEPPTVEVAFRGIGTAVTPFARIPMAGKIGDDYGLHEIVLRASCVPATQEGTPEPSWSGPLPNPNGPNWEHPLDLRDPPPDWKRDACQPGNKLALVLHVVDNCQLTDVPHATDVSLAPLEIVRREELLALIEGRELGLRRRFEQILQEMEEARDALVRIKTDLTSTDTNIAGRLDAQELRLRRVDSHAKRAQPEIEGMAVSYADIWLELQNNRVDTPELQERIATHLTAPLEALSRTLFPEYAARVQVLRETTSASTQPPVAQTVAHCDASIEAADQVLLAMRELLSRMLQLEDFNELIDLVREMLHQQEGLLQDTEKMRKETLKDLLDE